MQTLLVTLCGVLRVDGSRSSFEDESSTMLQAVHSLSVEDGSSTMLQPADSTWFEDKVDVNTTASFSVNMEHIKKGCADVINTRPSETECGSAVTGALGFLATTWAQAESGQLDVPTTLFSAGDVALSGISLALPLTALGGSLVLGYFKTFFNIGGTQSMSDFKTEILGEVDAKIRVSRVADDMAGIEASINTITNELKNLPRNCQNSWEIVKDEKGEDVEVCIDETGAPRTRQSITDHAIPLKIAAAALSLTIRQKAFGDDKDLRNNWAVPAMVIGPVVAELHLALLILCSQVEHSFDATAYAKQYKEHFLGIGNVDKNDWITWAHKYHGIVQDTILKDFEENLDPWIGVHTDHTGPQVNTWCQWHNMQHRHGGGGAEPEMVFGSVKLKDAFEGMCKWSITHVTIEDSWIRNGQWPHNHRQMSNGDWCTWENIMGYDGWNSPAKYNLCDNRKKVELRDKLLSANNAHRDAILKLAECDSSCQAKYNGAVKQWQTIALNPPGECGGTPCYLGCFADTETRAFGGDSPRVGFNACLTRCRGMGKTYMAVQHHDQCFCGDNLRINAPYVLKPAGDCSSTCSNGQVPAEVAQQIPEGSHGCGGAWKNSIYKIGA